MVKRREGGHELGVPEQLAAVRGDSRSLSAAERGRQIQRVLILTLGLNMGASAVKLGAGALSGSLALTAGGVDSFFDAGANVIGLLGARAAAKPPDADHPYGHRKLETIVAVVIVVLLFITCAKLVAAALPRLFEPGEAPLIGPLALLAPIVAFTLNQIAAHYEAKWGRRLGSELLLADATHTRADAAVSIALVVGMIAIRAGYPIVDPILGLAIAGVIAWVGLNLARETAAVLVDTAVLDPEQVRSVAMSVPGVEGAHKIRSRGPGDDVAVDLHVQVDPALGLDRGHEIGHQVQQSIEAAFPGVADVVVQVEPDWTLRDSDIEAAVRRVAGRYPLDVHEIHVHSGADTEVGLHVEMDPTLSLGEAHARASDLEDAILDEVEGVDRVVTHLEPRIGDELVAQRPSGSRDYESLVRHITADIPGLEAPHEVEIVQVSTGRRLSMHVCAAGDVPLAEAHAMAEGLEARIRAEAPELDRVTIHVEPPESAAVP